MTGLRGKAYLEIDLVGDQGTERSCVFELKEDLKVTGETSRDFLLGQSGQVVRRVWDITSAQIDADAGLENRRGYHVDGGAGGYVNRIEATAGDPDMQWGDGSTDPDDPDDITTYDATGCDRVAQKQVLEYVNSQATTDSNANARLLMGEWTDGRHEGDVGVFGRPLTIGIRELTVVRDPDDPSALNVTIEGVWTAVYPDVVGWAQDKVADLADEIPDF